MGATGAGITFRPKSENSAHRKTIFPKNCFITFLLPRTQLSRQGTDELHSTISCLGRWIVKNDAFLNVASPGGLGQNRLDGPHEAFCRFDAQLHRQPRSRSPGLVHKVDVQGMLERYIEGVVIRYGCLMEAKPICLPFAAALDLNFLRDHCTHIGAPVLGRTTPN